ncbi:hypothetical protein [Actinophytocola sediminis]
MRNAELNKLDGLVGEWTVTLTNAWFLDPPEFEVPGKATIEWLGDACLVWRMSLGNEDSDMTWVIGRTDARDRYVMLYHDERGVCRVFGVSFVDGHWEMVREDPDMHQRFIGDLDGDRITARTEMSDDQGVTWRKDFDLFFERVKP